MVELGAEPAPAGAGGEHESRGVRQRPAIGGAMRYPAGSADVTSTITTSEWKAITAVIAA
jgi:hypothetical protein